MKRLFHMAPPQSKGRPDASVAALCVLIAVSMWLAGVAAAVPYANCDCNMAWVTEYPAPTNNTLNAIWGTGPNDVWAAGAGGVLKQVSQVL